MTDTSDDRGATTLPKPMRPLDFLRTIVARDLETDRYGGRVHTRFPPEPNGYLHIGHAKSICLNFGIAAEFGGLCNLRFDDTNPTTEEAAFVESMQNDIRWLGFDWEDRLFYASDYFERLYQYAEQLVSAGKAYVCELSEDDIRRYRGTVTEPGAPSPYRDRAVEENLDLLRRMRAGEFDDGAMVLRAKIDMSSPNMKMRDPLIYRIRRAHHYRTGDRWCIYPMYDWAHGLSDSLEGITHSICTLEFENNRELYDWFLIELGVYRPQQIEFARLNLTHTVMSKRKLKQLVDEGHVEGWDDPRMPTLAGMRRRGYPPAAIRSFCDEIGVSRTDSVVSIGLLEHHVRQDLNLHAPRVMAVLQPLRLVIDNYPEGEVETFDAVNNPEDPTAGTRPLPFARELWIEQDDFREEPPPKFFRLAPGREVRLKHAYIVKCERVEKGENGEVTAVHCSYDPETRGGQPRPGQKVKGTLHWVSAAHGHRATVRLFDHLMRAADPAGEDGAADLIAQLNPASLEVLEGCQVEASLGASEPGDIFQFLRHGYFCTDITSKPDHPVFNRTVSLKDSWAKIEKQSAG